ncbi:putative lipoprotein [Synechococcus sp. BIOS-E4-1]|nr:putative lipoprotein [Synechococcus sp. BIOS-E4-1]
MKDCAWAIFLYSGCNSGASHAIHFSGFLSFGNHLDPTGSGSAVITEAAL